MSYLYIDFDTILFGIGAILFFYARNENLEIAKILFCFSFVISFSCFLYTHYNSLLEKNIEGKEVFVTIIGLVIFFKYGFYTDIINGIRN